MNDTFIKNTTFAFVYVILATAIVFSVIKVVG